MSDRTLIDDLFERQKVQLRLINQRLDLFKAALDRAEIDKRRFTFVAFWAGWVVGAFAMWWVSK